MNRAALVRLFGSVVERSLRAAVCLLISASVLVNTTLKPYADALDDAAADANSVAPGLIFDPAADLGSYDAGTLTLGQGAGSVVIPDTSISIDEIFPGATHGGAADLEALFGDPEALGTAGVAGAKALEDVAATSPHGVAWGITSQTRDSTPLSIQTSDPEFYAELRTLNELSRLEETFAACETVSVPGTLVEKALSFEEARACLRFDGPGGLSILEQGATVALVPGEPLDLDLSISPPFTRPHSMGALDVDLIAGEWRYSYETCDPNDCNKTVDTHHVSGGFEPVSCESLTDEAPSGPYGVSDWERDCATGTATLTVDAPYDCRVVDKDGNNTWACKPVAVALGFATSDTYVVENGWGSQAALGDLGA
ncbi:MAG: hypothetical protein AAFR52_08895, partial [Pseudomonadota bacterium]